MGVEVSICLDFNQLEVHIFDTNLDFVGNFTMTRINKIKMYTKFGSALFE